jgi:hypothetical protein
VFYIVTTGGWSDYVSQQANVAGQGLQPIMNHNAIIKIVGFLYYVFGNMVLYNIVIGVSADTFKKLKE